MVWFYYPTDKVQLMAGHHPTKPEPLSSGFFSMGNGKTSIHNVEHLENKIHDVCRSVTAEMLIHVKRPFWTRIQIFENSGGQHFEHFVLLLSKH